MEDLEGWARQRGALKFSLPQEPASYPGKVLYHAAKGYAVGCVLGGGLSYVLWQPGFPRPWSQIARTVNKTGLAFALAQPTYRVANSYLREAREKEDVWNEAAAGGASGAVLAAFSRALNLNKWTYPNVVLRGTTIGALFFTCSYLARKTEDVQKQGKADALMNQEFHEYYLKKAQRTAESKGTL
ncbi:hypothetical protein QOT17_008720 [Balamuthia mandrillaris]